MKKVITDAQKKATEAAHGAHEGLKQGVRRGSEAFNIAAETTARLLTAAAKQAAEFASWVSRVMKDVHVKFEKFEADLKTAKTQHEKETVVNNAVDLAVTTHVAAHRMSQRDALSASEQQKIRNSYRASVTKNGLVGLKKTLEVQLNTLKEEEEEHVPFSMGPPPPPPVQHTSQHTSAQRSLPPIPPVQNVQKRVSTSTSKAQVVKPVIPPRPAITAKKPVTSVTEPEVERKPTDMELALKERIKKGLKPVEQKTVEKKVVNQGKDLKSVLENAMRERGPKVRGYSSDVEDDNKPTKKGSSSRRDSWQKQ